MNRVGASMSRPVVIVAVFLSLLFLGDHLFMASKSPSSGASTSSGVAHAAIQSSSTLRKPPIRILCYGDSLTAGTISEDYNLHPYAPFLERALKEAMTGDDDVDIQVRHAGYPGWTAQQMVAILTEDQGLVSKIRRIQDPPLSLVIILAGTNDLGHGSSADDIFSSIRKLHQAALDESVPATLAIAIPPSGYTSQNEAARNVVDSVNHALQQRSSSDDSRLHFVPFPFPYERNGQDWSRDGLHLSAQGYQRLGESLVSVVQDARYTK